MSVDSSKARQILVTVSPKLHESLSKKAAEAKMSVTAYSTLLFQAAASERVKPGSAPDLHIAIGRVVVLWGNSTLDTTQIGMLVGLSEATVVRIVEAWKAEALTTEASAA